jgi:chromosome segregation ATPase
VVEEAIPTDVKTPDVGQFQKLPDDALPPEGADRDDKSEEQEFDTADTARANAQAKIQELEDRLTAMDRAQMQLNRERDFTLKELDKARELLTGYSKGEHPATVIQNYLERQKEIRAEQVGAVNRLKQAGFTASMFRTGSPLDESLRKKRTQG